MTALYLERYFNFGLTMEELKAGKPIIGIAQSGSDLSPCNRIHIELPRRGTWNEFAGVRRYSRAVSRKGADGI